MNRQDLKDMIESLVIDIDPEHTFDHSRIAWVFIENSDEPSGGIRYIRFYDANDELLIGMREMEEEA